MTQKQTHILAILVGAVVFGVYLWLLNIDLASDAQAGVGYLFYGPPGLVPSFFAFAFVKTLPFIWKNRSTPRAVVANIILALICLGMVVGLLIYTSIRFAVAA